MREFVPGLHSGLSNWSIYVRQGCGGNACAMSVVYDYLCMTLAALSH